MCFEGVKKFMPSHKPLVIALMGPTASGKTDLAIEIAKKMKLRIHNVDSRQIYIGMDVGTAKPTKKQRSEAKHCLIDLCRPDQPITVKQFQQTALLSLEKALLDQGIGLLAGGSGLYLKSLLKGLEPPAVPPQKLLRKQFSKLGQGFCYELLKASDAWTASKISIADKVRTQRALEVLYCTGESISSLRTENPPPWRVLELGLNPKDLQERIARRTANLYKNGLIEETQKLANKFGADLPMLQTIGYGEAIQILNGELNLSEAIKLTTRRTQQFAKRQRTWFRRQHDPHWLNDEEPLREALTLIQAGIG